MQIVPAIGATCLGAVVGWLVRYFIRRFSKFSAQALGSVISVVLGGAAIKFLEADKTVWWFYPIGLFLGFVIYQIIVQSALGNNKGDQGKPAEPSLPGGWKSEPRFIIKPRDQGPGE